VRIPVVILLLALVACSTSQRYQDGRKSPGLAAYCHPAPSLAVVERQLYVGMASDDFAKLIGLSEPGWISHMTVHYSLQGGLLDTRHDSAGRLVWWEIQRTETK
jgi:hypothetical protein